MNASELRQLLPVMGGEFWFTPIKDSMKGKADIKNYNTEGDEQGKWRETRPTE